MLVRLRHYFWVIAHLLFCMPEAPAGEIPGVSHVVHISVDGLASIYLQEAMTAEPGDFPAFRKLMMNGAYSFNARIDFEYSVTLPNHTSMLTGRPVLQPAGLPNTTHHGFTINHDDGGTLHTRNPNLSYQASVFDVVHDHGLSTALLASKTKFEVFARTWDDRNGALDQTGVDNGKRKIDFAQFTETATNPPTYRASAPLVDSLLNGLTNAGWNYSFLHFAEPDSNGHAYGWGGPEWIGSVRFVDEQLGRILRAIESSQSLSNSTAIILSTDHGGFGFGHGNPARHYEYTIPFFVWRPGIPGQTEVYDLFANRTDPGTNRIDYLAAKQPLRNGDGGNLALALLGLPPVPGSLMRPELGPLRFRLMVERTEGTLNVSWPVEATGYTLESASRLSPEADWQPVSNGINRVGSRMVYSAPLTTGTRLFRLRK